MVDEVKKPEEKKVEPIVAGKKTKREEFIDNLRKDIKK